MTEEETLVFNKSDGHPLKPKSKTKNQTYIFILEKNQKRYKSVRLSVQNLLSFLFLASLVMPIHLSFYCIMYTFFVRLTVSQLSFNSPP